MSDTDDMIDDYDKEYVADLEGKGASWYDIEDKIAKSGEIRGSWFSKRATPGKALAMTEWLTDIVDEENRADLLENIIDAIKNRPEFDESQKLVVSLSEKWKVDLTRD